jgi:hypothetical protein
LVGKGCGKKEESGDFSYTDQHQTETMLGGEQEVERGKEK